MYALIINESVEEYPANRALLQKRNPRVSFPKNLTDEIWNTYGFVRVVPTNRPDYDEASGELVEDTPEFRDGSWYQQWKVELFSTDELNQRQAERDTLLRSQQRATRNQLLQETDIDVIRSLETTNSIPENLKNYRQALRDLPAQEGFPSNITWPTKPS